MTMDPWEEINLEQLGGGRAMSQVNECLRKVVANIIDPNTDPKQARTVTLKIKLKPAADRSSADVEYQAEAKLAADSAGADHLSISRNGKGYINTMTQADLPGTEARLVPETQEGTND